MESILKTIDKLFESIPTGVAKAVRLSSILIWLVLATVVIFYSVMAGSTAAPQTGEDLSMATFQEQIQKERNIRSPGELTVPDLSELVTEDSEPDFRVQRSDRNFADEGVDIYPERAEPFEPINPIQSPETMQNEVPYQTEPMNPYPERRYIPEEDAGNPGERTSSVQDRTGKKQSLDPLPLVDEKKERESDTEKKTETRIEIQNEKPGLLPLE